VLFTQDAAFGCCLEDTLKRQKAISNMAAFGSRHSCQAEAVSSGFQLGAVNGMQRQKQTPRLLRSFHKIDLMSFQQQQDGLRVHIDPRGFQRFNTLTHNGMFCVVG
jgi:hypothetical protein